MKLIYRYDQLDLDILYYDTVKHLCNNKDVHSGQLKLFFAELLFLSKYSKSGDTVLYVGAASGYHIGLLAKMFPEITFDLWDRTRFHETLSNFKNIKMNKRYFTDADAQLRTKNNDNLLFMCDMRNIEIRKQSTENALEDIVNDDMDFQYNWCKIMKPRYAYLKFRLRYNEERKQYFGGKIYLQPYSPLSTESRLLTNDYETKVTYVPYIYDMRFAYFNVNYRCKENDYKKKSQFCRDNNLANTWDNIYSLGITKKYLKSNSMSFKDNDILTLFNEICAYHIKEYPRVYKIVYAS